MKKLLTPRWLFGHLLAFGLVVLFVNFGFWQLRRLAQREAYNALLEARLEARPQPFGQLVNQYSSTASERAEDSVAYRRAQVTGRFDTANELLLRSRALNEQPGYHVLTPLRLASGRALLVDRGWVPFALDDPPIREAAPPPEKVTVTGILQPAQPEPTGGGFLGSLGLVQKDPAKGKLEAAFFVDPARLSVGRPYTLEPVFLELATQTPAQSGQLPVPPPPPEISQGPHLSYAFQWFSFALIGIVGYVILLRGVLRDKPVSEEVRPEEDLQPEPENSLGKVSRE